jgi:hypothetical protein
VESVRAAAPEPARAQLRAIRPGEVPLPDVLDAIDEAEHRLVALRGSADLPDEPDRVWADAWLHRP